MKFLEMRRPILAMIAASAVVLGGATMPTICLRTPAIMYVAGQVRLAFGDQEGGLRMISVAAASKQQPAADAPKIAPASETPKKMCSNEKRNTPAAVKVSTVSANAAPAAKFVTVAANAPKPDVQQIVRMSQAQAEQLRAEAMRSAFANNDFERRFDAERVKVIVARVHHQLEHDGVPTAPAVLMAIPPAPPVTNP